MIELRYQEEFAPIYMSQGSSGCDVKSTIATTVAPGAVAKIPTGVFISGVNWELVPPGFVPEIQIRARSGLAFKHSVSLANGVGTIDADYPEEIAVLIINHSDKPFEVEKGQRIAQMVLGLVPRFSNIQVHGAPRESGFGSTGVK
jgi:dUTP pyrophosphatase